MITQTYPSRSSHPTVRGHVRPDDDVPHVAGGPGHAPRAANRYRRVAAVASAALGVLLLAACASPAPAAAPGAERSLPVGPVPEIAPDPPPAEIRTVAPELPADLAADDAGAIEAVKHALNVLEHVSYTGELAAWEEITDPACSGCRELADAVRARHAAGGRLAGPYPQWLGTPAAVPAQDAGWRVDLLARIPETREIAADGETQFREAYRLEVGALISHDDDAWVVHELEVTELPVE